MARALEEKQQLIVDMLQLRIPDDDAADDSSAAAAAVKSAYHKDAKEVLLAALAQGMHPFPMLFPSSHLMQALFLCNICVGF